jgi:hypothetical protein
MGVTLGDIGICQQRVIAGWALENGGPTVVRIRLNGKEIAAVAPSVARPDVAKAFGVDPLCGFACDFPRGIRASDQIEVEIGATGTHIDPLPHRHRIASVVGDIDASAPGLEFGALDRPFLDREHFNVLYVDHADAASLKKKYLGTATKETLDASKIVDVDIVWKPDTALLQCSGGRSSFAYAVALQVLEHVGDPIGWLNEVASCLLPGGRINVTLPEMTRTFDYRRRLTNASDLIEAFEHRYSRPRLRQVFDHIANVAIAPAEPDQSEAALRQALAVARIAEDGQYVDVHCHVWTHDSFLDCWRIIERVGLCRARLDRSWPAVASSNEFTLSFVV